MIPCYWRLETDIFVITPWKTHPTFKLMLSNIKSDSKALGMKDIRSLIVSTLAHGPAVSWADIKLQSRIQHITLVILDSLSLELYKQAAAKGFMPFFSSKFTMADAKAPGNATRVYDGMSVLLRNPMSKSQLKSAKKERNAILSALPSKPEAPAAGEETPTEAPTTAPVVNVIPGPATTTVQLAERLETSKALAEKSYFSEKTEISPGQALMSFSELEANQYPLSHTITERGYVEISKYRESTESSATGTPKYHILAIDCEMCRTMAGIELTRVVVVNTSLETVYDSFAKPKAKITDYLTRYSGITAEILAPVTVTLDDIQRDLLQMIHPHTILIGHSLENDLKALKISHLRVVDTALLYPHIRGDTYKNSLRFLAENWLGEQIQTMDQVGHDPTQDAATALKLAILKFRQGAAFGRLPIGDNEENICDYLFRNGKRTSITDNGYACKTYGGSRTDLCAEEDDASIVHKANRALVSCHYEFASARLRALAKYYTSLEKPIVAESDANASSSTTAPAEPIRLDDFLVSQPDNEKELELCKQMDDHLQAMLAGIPKRTLVIVTGGNGNLARMKTVVNVKKKIQSLGDGAWSESDDAKSRIAFEKARETIVGFWIPPLAEAPQAAMAVDEPAK